MEDESESVRNKIGLGRMVSIFDCMFGVGAGWFHHLSSEWISLYMCCSPLMLFCFYPLMMISSMTATFWAEVSSPA